MVQISPESKEQYNKITRVEKKKTKIKEIKD